MGSLAHTPESLNSLAAKITELAARMTKQLEADKVPAVTLEADSPIKYERLPEGFFMARQEMEDALKDMYVLSQGPSESVFNWVHTVCCWGGSFLLFLLEGLELNMLDKRSSFLWNRRLSSWMER